MGFFILKKGWFKNKAIFFWFWIKIYFKNSDILRGIITMSCLGSFDLDWIIFHFSIKGVFSHYDWSLSWTELSKDQNIYFWIFFYTHFLKIYSVSLCPTVKTGGQTISCKLGLNSKRSCALNQFVVSTIKLAWIWFYFSSFKQACKPQSYAGLKLRQTHLSTRVKWKATIAAKNPNSG